jgi:ferredoxin
VDEDYWEGSSLCARICGEVFRVDPVLNKAAVPAQYVDDEAIIAKVDLVATTCPSRAILLQPADSSESAS